MVTLPAWEPRATVVCRAVSILHISLLPGETSGTQWPGESVGTWPTSGPCPPILMELCVWKMGIVESVTVRSLSFVTHSETR